MAKSEIVKQKIYQITAAFPTSEKNNLVSQLRRAVVSICANIAEGFGRYHSQESMQFYRTARGSLLEIKSHLYIAFDQSYITKVELTQLFDMIDEISKMLSSFINKTRDYRLNKLSSTKL